MKKVLPRIIAILLILVGVAVLSYPVISNWLMSQNQTVAITEYGLSVAQMNEESKQAELARAREYNDMLSGSGIVDPFLPESGYVLPEEYTSILNIAGVICHIEIPKVDLNLPVYHGTEEETLKKGVGHLQNTAFPIAGESNHTALTGHRGLPSAKLFTDLDKLIEGDKFYITILNEKATYVIDQIVVVEPSDTRELMPVAGKEYITLITCTPYGINSHRMFVRGYRSGEVEILDEIEEEPSLEIPTWLERYKWHMVAGGVGFVMVLFVARIIINKKKRRRS